MSLATDRIACRKSLFLNSQCTITAVNRRMGGVAGLSALLLSAAFAYGQALNFGPEAVGSTAGEQNVTVAALVSGTVSKVEVLTQGQAGLDFAPGAGVSCSGAILTVGGAKTSCSQSVSFTPSAPGMRMGAVVLLGSVNGIQAILGTAYVSGTGTGPLGVLVAGNVLPVAGQLGLYDSTNVGDGKPATSAELNLPGGLALDGAGNLYIADTAHQRIRMVCAKAASEVIAGTICAKAGIILTVAGNGNPGNSGDGPASSSQVNNPNSVAVDGAGNLYIADTNNDVVREIVAASGQIVTLAGGATSTTMCAGRTDAWGDGCPATQAMLNAPGGVAIDRSGNVYIADTNNAMVRVVSASTGTITAVVGNGTAGYNQDGVLATLSELNSPYAVAFDGSGNLYIPDSANNRIRRVAADSNGNITPASLISTFAGTGTAGYSGDGAAAGAAELYAPSAVAADAAGNVFIADTQNRAVRKVNSATNQISTLALDASGDYYFDGAFGKIAIYGPTGLALDGVGDLYVADRLDMLALEIQGNFVALDITQPVRQGSLSVPVPVTIENDGNAALDLTAINPSADAQLDATTTTCSSAPASDTTQFMAVAADCTVGAVFAPTLAAASGPLSTNIDVTSATANSPLNIELVGTVLAVNSTTTLVASNPDPSGYGQLVTFTVTVVTGTGTGKLTGTVSIADTFNSVTGPAGISCGALNYASTANSQDTYSATCPTSASSPLAVGQHAIVASYSNLNDPSHLSSSSPSYTQAVQEGTTTRLTSSGSPSTVGSPVTFTATVAISGTGGVAPIGSVVFMDGTNPLGTVNLASGVAQYATSGLAIGSHQIIADYVPDPSISAVVLASSSLTLTQDVQTSSTMTLQSSGSPSVYATAVTFTATLISSSGSPFTGTVNFYADGTDKIGSATPQAGNPGVASVSYPGLSVGTHSITATYGGDANNGTASATAIPQTVTTAPTSTTVAAKAGTAGEALAITATVSDGATKLTPTGTVTFTIGTTKLTANLSNGAATVNPVLAAGNYQVVAAYGGDANDGASQSPSFPLTVNLATSATDLTVSPAAVEVGGKVSYTATVTGTGVAPTGTVTFMAGTAMLGTATLAGGTATYTAATTLGSGSYSITASYGGDTDNSPSISASATLTIGLIPTTTDLGTSTTTGANPQTILIAVVAGNASPTPTGTVTFKSGTDTIGSSPLDSNGVATLTPSLATGTYTIVASYGGDSAHSPSTSQSVTISGTPAGFSLTTTPASVTMAASQNSTLTVNLVSNGGFSDTIGLGCASMPSGVTCQFSSPTMSLAANATASVQLTIDTNNPLTGGAAAMNSRPAGSGLYMAGILLPLSGFFGWLVGRTRKRTRSMLTMILAGALTAAAMLSTGCSGFTTTKAAAGTYVIQVTGTGSNSNVIHYQNVTVVITN